MKINATEKIAASFVLLLLVVATTRAAGPPVKIVDNGPDGSKLVFAILGDGYSADDQQKYQNDVADLVIEGLLGHDFYRDNRSAFNVYRFDLVSKDSGVSAPEGSKNTALKLKFTNDWNSCYFESSTDTDKLIDKAVAGIDKYPDYVLVIANESRYGGCHPGGNRLYATSGSGWQVVAHEYGHGIGHLFDEYWNDGAEPHNSTQVINVLNCSTELDKNRLSWRQFVSATLNIPPVTVLGPGIDPLTTVGMFEGCDYASSGIYRPAFTCRMREIESTFCPVCQAFMRNAVAPFIANPAPPPGPVPQQQRYLNVALRIKEGGGTELINVSQGTKLQAQPIKTPTDFVYEIMRGNNAISAGILSEDPFVVRGFPDPNHNRGELIGRSKSATVIIKVPSVDLSDASTDQVGLRLYKLRSQLPQMSTSLDATLVGQLKQQNMLDKKFEVSGNKVKKAAVDKIQHNNQ